MPDARLQRALPGDSVWSDAAGTPTFVGGLTVQIDRDAPAGTRPWYRLHSDAAGASPGPAPVIAAPEVESPPMATYSFALAPVRPNPAVGPAMIDFTLPAPGHARVDVLDLQGRRVVTLVDAALPAGPHSVTWNGHSNVDHAGAGIYFVRLVTTNGAQVRRFARLGGD